jgi:RNA polymerase sigma-70 factor, ECF subfamily
VTSAALPGDGRVDAAASARAEFDAFLTASYRLLVGIARGLTGDAELAEDLAQEACARAWERVQRDVATRSLEAWAATVVVNLSRSQLRRRRTRHAAAPELAHRARLDGPTADHGPGADLAVDVAHALRQLSHRQRQVTVLRFYVGLDVAEIAEHLGIAEGTVKTALFRARATLRPLLADRTPQEARHDG